MLLSRLKHQAKLLLQPEYKNSYLQTKELERLSNTPRHNYLSTDLLGKKLTLVDGPSFVSSYKEIFQNEIYYFKSSKQDPVIIDGGANLGISIIYLKKIYHDSKIIAFEADPKIFDVLKSNISSFSYNNVNLVNKAIWTSETLLEFAVEGADAGRLTRSVDEKLEKIQVHAVRLHDYLDTTIDFLKLDIEGAETDVILSCSDRLHNVRNIFIEYHSFVTEEQRLDELLHVLRKSQFRIQIHAPFSTRKPLVNHQNNLGMDLQLNIFGYRDI